MTNIADIDQPSATLRLMAKAISLGLCPEDEAYDFLVQAYRMGKLSGKTEAYRALRRSAEAELEARRAGREVKANG